jgi:adenine phosphoribosyltransferase
MNLKNYIRDFPNFPKPGILFRDISPLLRAPEAMEHVSQQFCDHFKDHKIDLIAGTEARGMLFASTLATTMRKGLIMVRKKGKLPGPTHHLAYELEYNSAALEVQQDAIAPGQNILIVDDLLATGGTSSATAKLIETLGGTIAGFAFVIELEFLNGRAALGNYNIKTLVNYND